MKLLGGNSPESYLVLLHRIYHTWCMWIGFVMVLFFSVQCSIGIFENFFSHSWLWTGSSPGLALSASAFVSVLVLDVSTSALVSAILLMADAWKKLPFIGLSRLIFLEKLDAGSDDCELSPGKAIRYDRFLGVLYFLLDAFPLIVALSSGSASYAWPMTVAIVSVSIVLVHYVADVVHDYWCKWTAWNALKSLRQESSSNGASEAAMEPQPSDMSYEEESLHEERGCNCMRGFWVQMQLHPGLRFFLTLSGVLLFLVLAYLIRNPTFAVFTTVVTLLMFMQMLRDVVHGRFQWCARRRWCYESRRLLFAIKTTTQHQADQLACHLDGNLIVTGDCTCDDWTVPAGSQLVSDGLLLQGHAQEQIKQYPVGSFFSFRQYVLNATDVFIEVHCGGSPVQLCVNAFFILGWCLLCVLVMIIGHYWRVLFVVSAGVLIFLIPAFCVLLAPRAAPKAHFLISVVVSILGTITGMAATTPRHIVFWSMPVLCLLSHCLMRRRLHYKLVVTASLALIAAFVSALLFSQSLGAAYQQPFSVNALDWSHNFTFNATGVRNPYPGPGDVRSPLCMLRYPTSDAKQSLSIVDFALFNKVVYEPHVGLREKLGRWMGNWTLVKSVRREERHECHANKHCDAADWTSWFAFEGKDGLLKDTTVVTIRGTKSILETIFDLDLWALDILGLNTFAGRFAGVGPVVQSFWQSETVAKLYFKWKRRRYASVFNYLKDRLANEPNRTFYITGHSLGGGLSHVVAAQVAMEVPSRNIHAVAISAPGVTETIRKLGLDPEALQGLAINVLPISDPVPVSGGSQAGTNYEIQCLTRGVSCHRIFNTVCEVMRECGDPAEHRRIFPCDFCPMLAQTFYKEGKAPACKNVKVKKLPWEPPPWDPRTPPTSYRQKMPMDTITI